MQVVCRELNFEGALEALTDGAEFEVGSNPIQMNNIECTGDEARLADCTFNMAGMTNGSCLHGIDVAGVRCCE